MLNSYLLDIEDGPFHLIEDFIDPEASQSYFNHFIESVPWRKDKIKIFGKIFDIPRLQAWYGDQGFSYTYSGIKMEPLPWTPELSELKNRVEQISGFLLNSVLINLYRNGQDSNGWHSDDEPELGLNPQIASISLGEERVFQLRHKETKERKDLILKDGSLLLMSGTAQTKWKHQIPKTKKNLSPRINLTFRRIFP